MRDTSTPAPAVTDLTGDGAPHSAEIRTDGGIIIVSQGVSPRANTPVVEVNVEPNEAGYGRIRTAPGGHWDVVHGPGARSNDILLVKQPGQ